MGHGKAVLPQVFGALYPAQLPAEHIAKFPLMDPVGLWLDPFNAAMYYPPSHAERVDAWTAKNAPRPPRSASVPDKLYGYLFRT